MQLFGLLDRVRPNQVIRDLIHPASTFVVISEDRLAEHRPDAFCFPKVVLGFQYLIGQRLVHTSCLPLTRAIQREENHQATPFTHHGRASLPSSRHPLHHHHLQRKTQLEHGHHQLQRTQSLWVFSRR